MWPSSPPETPRVVAEMIDNDTFETTGKDDFRSSGNVLSEGGLSGVSSQVSETTGPQDGSNTVVRASGYNGGGLLGHDR